MELVKRNKHKKLYQILKDLGDCKIPKSFLEFIIQDCLINILVDYRNLTDKDTTSINFTIGCHKYVMYLDYNENVKILPEKVYNLLKYKQEL